ncbi:MAG: Acetophenone carboxylase delta subunit [Candidatus Heimdallarchaeota archaeon LC_2]|nr:MAG: Acetophenone carboxylase delta subunit [Candidatus Heimdallarchaeota archaeon LC_2]
MIDCYYYELMTVDPISLTILHRRLQGITEEMSLVLRKTAYSPNIKERADFSCAIFDTQGDMVAQAEAIPVHLGSMPFVAKPIIRMFQDTWQSGDAIITNSPRSGFGGTHLPDITLLAPVFNNGEFTHLLAARAHHADVGGMSPGSLPAQSTEIFQEGLIIPPVRLYIEGKENVDVMNLILENVRTPFERRGDLRAQYSALRLGVRRMIELTNQELDWDISMMQSELHRRSEETTIEKLKSLGTKISSFTDYLDSDGINVDDPVRISCKITLPGNGTIEFDFAGSDDERIGNCNAPFSVTQSACFYIVRLLVGDDVLTNAGCFRPVHIIAPEASVVNPTPNVATSSANTETSSRIVDVLMGAMNKIIPWPSSSQGTMNNLLIGGIHDGKPWSIYETIGGGTGAGPSFPGTSAIQSNMTNTENTPIEALELSYPLRVREYSIRKDSGGKGEFRGGDGIIREIEILSNATITLQTERRRISPWGQGPGETHGNKGINEIFELTIKSDSGVETFEWRELDSKVSISNVKPGSKIKISTPGGGGFTYG